MAGLIIDNVCRRLIDRIVVWLPEQGRERFREEWQAHLDELDSSVGKTSHVVGCAFSLVLLSRELRTQRLAVAPKSLKQRSHAVGTRKTSKDTITSPVSRLELVLLLIAVAQLATELVRLMRS
jgi:hypothetical protein